MLHKLRTLPILILVLVLALGLVMGCEKKGEEISLDEEMPPPGEIAMPTVPSTVMVPDEISSQWKSVTLELTDLATNERADYTINIGETAPLGDSGLTVYVEAFLPDFTMMGDTFTSKSNELNNPAARVKITDETGSELYYRFLFSNHPLIHPFEHDRYGLVLKDYTPAE